MVTENLRNQFLISKDKSKSIEGWNYSEFGDWKLHYHPSLPLIKIMDMGAKFSGFILGYATYLNRMCEFEYRCSSVSCKSIEAFVENQIYKRLNGRYIFLIQDDISERFYLDPGGTLSAIYSMSEQIICSTTILLNKTRKSSDWIGDEKNKTKNLYFGRTNFSTVRRILPNHFLDAKSWKCTRHYPNEYNSQDFNLTRSLETIKVEMVNLIEALSTYGLNMAFTGGADARIILSCAKGIKNKMVFVNSELSEDQVDRQITERLIRDFDLKSIDLGPSVKISDKLDLFFSEMLGYQQGIFSFIPGSLTKLPKKSFVLTGVNGEIGRGKYFTQQDSSTSLKLGDLLLRFGICMNDYTDEELDEWKILYNQLDKFQLLDLIFLEQISGCISGPNTYIFDSLGFNPIHGFNGRTMMEEMLSLESQYRLDELLVVDLCQLNWKSLLIYPINKPIPKFFGIRKLFHNILRNTSGNSN